jgi:hypothetical protein
LQSTGQLLFGKLPSFPTIWIVASLGFVSVWWYVSRDRCARRRTFLILWLPAALVSGAVYTLNGHGYATTDALRLLVRRDPATWRLVHWIPSNGFAATYAAVVGGAVAAFATMALHLAGLLFGAVLGLGPSSRPRPS